MCLSKDLTKVAAMVLAMSAQTAWSDEDTNTLFPRIGRAMLSAGGAGIGPAAGDGIGIFGGDVMQPLYGNDNGFFFADFMGDLATGNALNTFLLSPGVGFRQVFNNQIWGAYLFGDNEEVGLGKHFWNVSPGIEWMAPNWDMHANAYIAIPGAQAMGTPPVFADTLGNYDYVNFVTGTHDQFDALVAPYDVIGNGFDVEMAYRFTRYNGLASRVYVGGYFYQPSNSDFTTVTNLPNIAGITAGIEQSLTKNTRIWLMNSYDSLNAYTIGFRLQLTFGDASTLYSNDVHDRLLEPLERHVGVIGTGAGNYDQLGYKNLGNGLEYSNVYFFAPGGTGNGTYGSPMALTQASLNLINSENPNSARLYLQGGDPPIYPVNATTAPTYAGLLLYNGQDLYGRSANYTAPAASGQQPIISVDGADGFDGFIIHSGENTFNDLAITASSLNGTTAGIYLVTSTNATVNVLNTSMTSLNQGLYAENDATGILSINATNSSFSGNTNSGINNAGTYGIYAYNGSTGNMTINVSNSFFNDNTDSGDNNGGTYGLFANNVAGNMTINASSSSFNGNINTNTTSGNRGANGLYALGNNTGNLNITIISSQFNDNLSTAPTNAGESCGLCASSGNQNFNIVNSSFNGNMTTGESNNDAYGISVFANTLTLTITNSTFNGNINNKGNVGDNTLGTAGLFVYVAGDTGIINVANSQFNGNMILDGGGVQASEAFGFGAFNGSNTTMTVNVMDSQFNNNVSTGDGTGGAYGFVIQQDSINTMVVNVSNSEFNGNIASGDNNAGAFGVIVFNFGDGLQTISATQSQFNGNIASGTNNGGGFGFYASNNNGGTGSLSVTSLVGSTIGNNSAYGLYAIGNPSASTTINLTGAIFYGNPINVGNEGDVTFTE